MTHFIFGTRGIYAATQQMISDLVSQRFWWRRKDLNEFLPNGKPNPNYGKIQDAIVQGMLRPIQLWEYVYPDKSPLQPGNPDSPMEDNTEIMMRSFDLSGPTHYIPRQVDWAVSFARKKLGLKEIPTLKNMDGNRRVIHQQGISTIPIGIKEDVFETHEFGDIGKFEQEML